MITNSLGDKTMSAANGQNGPEQGEALFEAESGSVDIVYQKLLEDLKRYCTEREIEEKCREYSEMKKAGKRQGGVIPTQSAKLPRKAATKVSKQGTP